jgi:hypothetical protein
MYVTPLLIFPREEARGLWLTNVDVPDDTVLRRPSVGKFAGETEANEIWSPFGEKMPLCDFLKNLNLQRLCGGFIVVGASLMQASGSRRRWQPSRFGEEIGRSRTSKCTGRARIITWNDGHRRMRRGATNVG